MESASAGDIIAVAGIPEITIGETLSDPDDPRQLPVITVDEPSISMTIGINTSPLAGRSGGSKLTAPMVKSRLEAEKRSAMSLFVCCRPSARTHGRCRAEESCNWRSSWS